MPVKRKGISKKARFEVFKRDSFTCQYCGRSAPVIALVVDHVVPVAAGGSNDASNLVCSCEDCNAGKSSGTAYVAATNTVDIIRLCREVAASLERVPSDYRSWIRALIEKHGVPVSVIENSAMKSRSWGQFTGRIDVFFGAIQ